MEQNEKKRALASVRNESLSLKPHFVIVLDDLKIKEEKRIRRDLERRAKEVFYSMILTSNFVDVRTNE